MRESAVVRPEEKRIRVLFFLRDLKCRSWIATEPGISQMHVSRLLARTRATLREGLVVED
jgi:RNA polymerase sigma-B factor